MMTSSPASTAQAANLLKEYKKILTDFSSLLALGAPECLLPASKDELRHAMRAIAKAQLLDPTGLTDTDTLRNAYASLATFISYDDAHAAAQLHAACERGDMKFMASPVAERVMARAQRIEREASALGREFDEWLHNQGPLGLLSDIDALLAELDTKYTAPAHHPA
jgi:hypothetical protein